MKNFVNRISHILDEEAELHFLRDEFVEATLDKSALAATDERGFTALDWAISNGRHDLAKNLCRAIIDFFADDEIRARDIIKKAAHFLPKSADDIFYRNMVIRLNRRYQDKLNEKKGDARRAYPYP